MMAKHLAPFLPRENGRARGENACIFASTLQWKGAERASGDGGEEQAPAEERARDFGAACGSQICGAVTAARISPAPQVCSLTKQLSKHAVVGGWAAVLEPERGGWSIWGDSGGGDADGRGRCLPHRTLVRCDYIKY